MERIQLNDKYFKPFIPNSRIEEDIDKVAETKNPLVKEYINIHKEAEIHKTGC